VYINTRVLILTNDVKFSMQTAQALERAGAFKVAPFASVENALTALQHSPQEVVLLDTSLSGLNVESFIVQVREIQPDIAFILLPESTTNQQLVARLSLHGVADVTWTARRLLPLIKAAQRRVYDDQPKTAQVKAATPTKPPLDESTRRISALNVPGDDPVEFLLSDAADGETRVEVIAPDDSKGLEIFKILADEEPPMPSFEESATIHDLRVRLVNPAFLKEISGIARDMDDEDDATPQSSGGTPQEDEPSTAALILASSADDSTPLDAFSLEDFLARIQEKLLESGRTLQPLPSWVQESEKYVREPDFLDDDLPGIISPSTPLEYTSSITTPSQPQPQVPDYNDMETERSQPVIRSYPVSEEEVIAAAAELLPPPSIYDTYLGEDDAETLDLPPELITDMGEKEQGTTRDLPAVSLAAGQTDLPPMDKETETTRTPIVPLPSAPTAAEGERAYIEKLTVTLVQVSLELTAEATLLIREGQIIAHDGVLPIDDVGELFHQPGHNWEAEPLQGRIRFLTLPASGQDYMLYSRGMETGVTLCLIFAGTLPLYTIRRQGKRLADALASVPAPPLAFFESEAEATVIEPVDEELEDVETGELLPFTYLWPVRDESVSLSLESRQALFDYYQRQLPRRGWDIQAMDIQEDYIYLAVTHPATQSASERLQDLQQRAASVIERIHDTPTDLWASSYTVLIPGRALTTDEIQDFLEFARS